jgi:hypothetical protein
MMMVDTQRQIRTTNVQGQVQEEDQRVWKGHQEVGNLRKFLNARKEEEKIKNKKKIMMIVMMMMMM